MKNTRIVISKHGENRYLEKEDNSSYLIWGESEYTRHNINPETGELDMLDYEGGPCIVVGDTLCRFQLPCKKVIKIIPADIEDKKNCYCLLVK